MMDDIEEQKQLEQSHHDDLLHLVISKEHLKVNNFLKHHQHLNSKSLFNKQFQYAAFMSDPTMIKLFLTHQQRLKKLKYDSLIYKFFTEDCLQQLPDFNMTINWHCDSDFIPFLSKLAPHDTIRIFKSSKLNTLRIDFNQQGHHEKYGGHGKNNQSSSSKKAMSLLFEAGEIKLVDHQFKTVSCDLYELLVSDGGFNKLDGEAIEIANSQVLEENQIVNMLKESDDRSKKQGQGSIHKKLQISLQNWERRRIPDTDLFHKNKKNEVKIKDLSELFEDVMMSEKQIPINVCLRKDEIIKQKHLVSTLEVLSCVYPEVKKVKKLATTLMNTVSDQFIPSQIKIPVVSSLGIKAIVNIGKVDYTPFTALETETIFKSFKYNYKNLKMTDDSSFVSVSNDQQRQEPILKHPVPLNNQSTINIPSEHSFQQEKLIKQQRKTFKVDLSQKYNYYNQKHQQGIDQKPVLKIKQRTRTSKIEPPRIFLTNMQKSTESLQSQTSEIIIQKYSDSVHKQDNSGEPQTKAKYEQKSKESRNLERIRSSQFFLSQQEQQRSETASTLLPSNFQSSKSSVLKVTQQQQSNSCSKKVANSIEVKYIQNTPICKLMAGRMSDVAVPVRKDFHKSGSQVLSVKMRVTQNRMSRGDAGRIMQTEDGQICGGRILQTQGSERLGGSVKSLSQSRSLFSRTNKINYVSQVSRNQSIYHDFQNIGASKGKMGSKYIIPTKKQNTDRSKFDDQKPYLDSCASKFNTSQYFDKQILKTKDRNTSENETFTKESVYGSLMVPQKKTLILNPSKVKIKVLEAPKPKN